MSFDFWTVETWSHILGISSILSCLAGIVYSFLRVVETWIARKKLRERLMTHRDEQLREMIDRLRAMRSDAPEDEAYVRALKLIEGEIPYLKESQRRPVLEALHQPCSSGRRSFVTDLLESTRDSKEALTH